MIGAALFLLQVLSLTPSRAGVALAVAAVIVLFSGLDVIGDLWRAPHFAAHWDITRHLEWWAGRYQYSSMTTQLFWVPNHALGGWLTIGLLLRGERDTPLDSMLPMIVVAVALWSPLAALGAVPFVLWKHGGPHGARTGCLAAPSAGLGAGARGGPRGRRLFDARCGPHPQGMDPGQERHGPLGHRHGSAAPGASSFCWRRASSGSPF